MKNKDQSTIEYAVLIAVIVAAMVGMNLYVRRSVQANLKSTEDQINVLDWEFKVIPTISPPPPPDCANEGEACGGGIHCCGPLKCIEGICTKILK